MGQEILYCGKCQSQLRSADFEKGAAFHIDGQGYCKKCARDVVKSFPPEKLDPLLKKAEQLYPAEKTATAGRPPGSQTERILKIASAPPPTRRRFHSGSGPKSAVALLAGLGVLGVVVLMLTMSGGSPPRPAPKAGAPLTDLRPESPAPPVEPIRPRPEPPRDPVAPLASPEKREEAAKEALRKAQDFASANPGDLAGQRSRFEEAAWEARNTSLQDIARAGLKGVEKRQLEALSVELSGLDERTRPALQREEFSAAIALLEEARNRHAGAEWTGAIDGKVAQVNEAAAKLYAPLKEKALAARKRGADAEMKAVRDRIGKWGLAAWPADLEKALADAVLPPVPPDVKPAPAEPVVKPPTALPRSTRPNVPDAARQREAETAVRKAFNLDQAKTPAEKSALARTLLASAGPSGVKDAELFVLLRTARDLAAQAPDARIALEAIDAMAAGFEIDGLAEKVALLTRTSVRGADVTAWARICLEISEETDDYDAAVKLADRAESLARGAGDRPFADLAKERSKELVEAKREADRIKAHAKTLETMPDDPTANAAMGRFLCLIKNDWPQGLSMAAKGADATWKRLAEQDVLNPTDPAAQAALGEAWAAQAEKEPAFVKPRLQARAALWLERAIPGLSGLGKISAERKLASLGVTSAAPSLLTLDLGAGARMELTSIKPGTFAMGSTEAPKKVWHADSRPPHQVTITKGYYLGKYEVTRGQFAAFVKATRYKTEAEREGKAMGFRSDMTFVEIPGLNWQSAPGQTDDHPVTCVSWNDARAFCDWLSGKAKRRVRLPTEAEWEYACRAGTRSRWSFGDDESAMPDYGWIQPNASLQTHPVGQKKPNAWGLFDMHGNVWEWCQDFAGPYSGEAKDPEGPASGEGRCLRGGSFSTADNTSDVRGAGPASTRWIHLGFRVAAR